MNDKTEIKSKKLKGMSLVPGCDDQFGTERQLTPSQKYIEFAKHVIFYIVTEIGDFNGIDEYYRNWKSEDLSGLVEEIAAEIRCKLEDEEFIEMYYRCIELDFVDELRNSGDELDDMYEHIFGDIPALSARDTDGLDEARDHFYPRIIELSPTPKFESTIKFSKDVIFYIVTKIVDYKGGDPDQQFFDWRSNDLQGLVEEIAMHTQTYLENEDSIKMYLESLESSEKIGDIHYEFYVMVLDCIPALSLRNSDENDKNREHFIPIIIKLLSDRVSQSNIKSANKKQ